MHKPFAAAMGLLLCASTYLALTATRVRGLLYLPTEGRIATTAPPGVIAMDWYFRAAVSLLAGALGVALGWLLARRWTALATPRAIGTTLGLALTITAWAAVFMVLVLVRT